MHQHLEKSTGDTFKCTMDRTILLVSMGMGKSIRIQKVKLGMLAFIVCTSVLHMFKMLWLVHIIRY